MSATTRHAIVLAAVLRVLGPLVRLLLRHGVTFPEFSAALKPVFLDAARAELDAAGRSASDSALSLLSGVHRRDVRELSRGPRAEVAGGLAAGAGASADASAPAPPASLIGELVGRWLTGPDTVDAAGHPRALSRAGFDALAASVSRDVRPRALLDEGLRLGAIQAEGDGYRLLREGFAPRQGFAPLAQLMADNLGDHAAAAVANLSGEENFLEQAVFVDRLSAASAEQVRAAARAAAQQALRQVLLEAQQRYDQDERAAAAPRDRRARFGLYFYTEPDTTTGSSDPERSP